MTSRQELADQIRYCREQKRLAKYYWKESVNSDSQAWADISMRAAKDHACNVRVFAPGFVDEAGVSSDGEIENISALLDTSAISDACAEYNTIEDIQFEALGELPTLRAEAEAAFDAPVSAQEIENIFAILDEPAETPLTPSQLKAEALLTLEQEACFHDAIIRAHHEGASCFAGPTLNESRIKRAQARMAQRQYFV